MKLYLAVTDDDYELIVCDGRSMQELANKLGIERCTVSKAIKRDSCVCHKYRTVTTEIEEDDNAY